MNNEFQKYNHATTKSFLDLIKTDDLVARKTENFVKVLKSGEEIRTVLHCGFGPIAVGLAKAGYEVSLLDSAPVPQEYAPLFVEPDFNNRYDAVIAADEYLTFATDEDNQKEILANICDLTKILLIVTLGDYKNMSENNRDYSDPQGYKTKDGFVTYLEKHSRGKSNFSTKVYEIDNEDNFTVYGPVARRIMYFKQLARQTEDNKAIKFLFQKNMMYKGMLKKSYEHIISINF